MEVSKQRAIERIIGNRMELWFLGASPVWLVADLKRKRSFGTAVDVFETASFTSEEWPLEQAMIQSKQSDWRSVLAADPEREPDFQASFIRWREHRKPFEEALRKEQEETKQTLEQIFADIAAFTIPDRHRIQLQLRGIRYKGVRSPEQIAETRGRRFARCWNCHRFLDNYEHFECLACGWILCRCGACGCPSRQTFSHCPMCAAKFRAIENRGCRPYCSWECKSTALEAYGEYLRSAQWQQRRQARLIMDKHACQDCGAVATDVHHKTYENIGREQPDDLVSLCGKCHAVRHGALSKVDYVENLVALLSD